MVVDSISDIAYIKTLMVDLEKNIPETYYHCFRVARLAAEIARDSGMSKKDIECVYFCGLLHDIGKLKVEKEVLEKKEQLTDYEFQIIKQHPIEGHALIKPYTSEVIANAILLHHERMDGSGYPFGLKAAEISIHARIIMIADTYDAMTVRRIYRKPVSSVEALTELASLRKQYDGELLNSLKNTLHKNVNQRIIFSI